MAALTALVSPAFGAAAPFGPGAGSIRDANPSCPGDLHGTMRVSSLTIRQCSVVTGSLDIIASGSVTVDKPLELAPGVGVTIQAKGPLMVNAPIGPEPHSTTTARPAQATSCPSPLISFDSKIFGNTRTAPLTGLDGGTDAAGDGCPGESIVIRAALGGVHIKAPVTGGNGGDGKSDKKATPGTNGPCHAVLSGTPRTVSGGFGGDGGGVTLVGHPGVTGGEVTGAGFVHAGNGGVGGGVLVLADNGSENEAGMSADAFPGVGGDGGNATLEYGSITASFGHAGAGGAPGYVIAHAGDGGPPNCDGGTTYVAVADGGKPGSGSLDPTTSSARTTPWNKVRVTGGNAWNALPPSPLGGGKGGYVDVFGGTPAAGAKPDIHAFVKSLDISDAGNGGPGSNGCPSNPGGNGGPGGPLESIDTNGNQGRIQVISTKSSDRLVQHSFNGANGGDGVPPGAGGAAGADQADGGLTVEASFMPGSPGGGCPQTGPKQTGFHVLPSPPGSPVLAAAGPTTGDVLIGLQNTDTVLAVKDATGTLDGGVGSGGTLPLPTGFPTSATVTGVAFGGGNIYAAFHNPSQDSILVGSWNAQGQLNSGFGSGGVVTILPNFDLFQDWTSTFGVLVTGQTVVVGAQSVDTPGVTLIPLNATTGAEGSPVRTAPPSGVSSIFQNLMLLGPDGDLYITGGGVMGSSNQVYFGIFNASTLNVISQSAFADGSTAQGNALTFGPGTTYIGVTDLISNVINSDLFSGPLGSTSGLTQMSIPPAVTGAGQGVFGLQYTSAGLIAGVYDQQGSGSSSVSTTWLDPLHGNTFGTPVQIGGNNDLGNVLLLPSSNGGVVVGTQASNGTNNPYVATFIP